jgi:hypothetical protein
MKSYLSFYTALFIMARSYFLTVIIQYAQSIIPQKTILLTMNITGCNLGYKSPVFSKG